MVANKDWLSELQKDKAKVPSPDKYTIKSDTLGKNKIALDKKPRYYFYYSYKIESRSMKRSQRKSNLSLHLALTTLS